MKMFMRTATLSLLVSLPIMAEAHRGWVLPSATVLPNNGPWVSFDAAVSNDIFHADHAPMRIEGLKIVSPSGQEVAPQNASTGKFRSVFDVELTEAGTWKAYSASSGLTASWEEEGKRKFWPPRGTAYSKEGFDKNVPKKADKLSVVQSSRRMETFFTSGNVSNSVLKPTNIGLELVPVTHPNDLVKDEKAVFSFLIDGKPAVNAEVEIVPAGRRYRDNEDAIELKTDKNGKVEIEWPQAGQYWMEVSYEDNKAVKPATKRVGRYSATLEVLP